MSQTPKKTPDKEDKYKVGYFNHFPKGNCIYLENDHFKFLN